MARPLRSEVAGAVYHVIARGDGGMNIFDDDKIASLGRICWKRLTIPLTGVGMPG